MIDLSEPASTDEKLAQMRKAFEQIMARNPCALIILADVSVPGKDAIVASATGSPIEVLTLHQHGTKALAAMILRADEEASAVRPGLNG